MTEGLKIKVGALVLVALALLVGFVALLGTFSVGAQVMYRVELRDSGSLLSGAPVKIAGVRAGRVDEVELLGVEDARCSAGTEGARVNVRFIVRVDAERASLVRGDSEFFVTSQGVLGEKYLEIVPGTPAAQPLAADACVRAHDPARLDVLFARAESILGQIESALAGGGDLKVGDLVANVTQLSGRLNDYLGRHRERLDQVTENLTATSDDVRAISKALREGLGGGEQIAQVMRDVTHTTAVLSREAGPLVVTTRTALQHLDAASVEVSKLVAMVNGPLEPVVGDLPEITGRLREISRDGAALLASLRDGKGVIGQVLVDDEIYDDLKEMLRDLKRHPWKLVWRE